MSTKKLQKIIVWSAYALVWVPLLYFPLSLYPLSFVQAMVLQMIVTVMLVASMWLWYREPALRLHRSPLLIAIVVFFLVQVLCAVVGVDWWQSLWSDMARSTGLWYQLHILGALLVFASPIFASESRIRVLRVSVWAASVVALIGIVQWWVPTIVPNVSTVRVGSTLGNPVLFASYLLLHLGIAGVLVAHHRRHLLGIAGIFVVLAFIALVMAQARGTYVGLAAGVCAALVVWIVLQRRTISRALLLWSVGAVILVLGVAGLFWTQSSSVRTWATSLLDGTTVSTRAINWGVAWEGFLERPLFGWGPENYRRVSDAYYNPALSEIAFVESYVDKPHSQLLELLATSGVVGGLAFGAVIVCLVRVLVRARREDMWGPGLVAVLVGAGVGHVVQMGFLFENPGTYVPVALLVGWVLAHEQRSVQGAPATSWRIPQSVVWVSSGVLGAAMLWGSVTPLVSATYTNYGLQLSYVGEWRGARDALYYAYSWYTPYRLERWRWTSGAVTDMVFVHSKDGTLEGLTPEVRAWFDKDAAWAQTQMNEILTTQPRSVLLLVMAGKLEYHIATLRHDSTLLERALAYFREATQLSPTREEGYLLQAQTLLQLERKAEAKAVMQEALQRAGETVLVHWYYGFPLLADPATVDEGLVHVERAMDLMFQFETAAQIDVVTKALVEKKKHDRLVQLYENVVQQWPGEPLWWSRLALAYGQVGRKAQARHAALRAIELDPSYRDGAQEFLNEIDQ